MPFLLLQHFLTYASMQKYVYMCICMLFMTFLNKILFKPSIQARLFKLATQFKHAVNMCIKDTEL